MQGRELGLDDDALTQSSWREAAALVQASCGEHVEAERLAREAVEITEQTDSPVLQGHAHFDLGDVLATAGHRDAAADAYRRALDLYEHNGIIPLARRTRERLAALQAPTV